MIKTKTFTRQLKIFHTMNELEDLDREIAEFISSNGITNVISVSDASTTGDKGETIGLIRTLTYEETPASAAKAAKAKLRKVV